MNKYMELLCENYLDSPEPENMQAYWAELSKISQSIANHDDVNEIELAITELTYNSNKHAFVAGFKAAVSLLRGDS